MPHTHEAAGEARIDMYGYHFKWGKSTLFVTDNPDDTNGLLIHFLCGGNLSDPNPPPLSIRNFRLGEYPGALALFHERFLRVFISYVLGWDLKHHRPFLRVGVFVHGKAFMGPNEEQARLSLHTHILVWLHGHDKLIERVNTPLGRE